MLRILFTGGGSGGHVYPLLSVADEFAEKKDVEVAIYYLGPKSIFDEEFENRGIKVFHIVSGKFRRYFSVSNIIDIPKLFFGFFQSLFRIYFIMPDVVFSKGGPGALPVVLAAKFYLIPVLIHESDAVPGLTNKLSSHFSKRIAVSFPEALNYFPKKKTALIGNPIRKELTKNILSEKSAKEHFELNPNIPVILILGGSQGSVEINNFVFNSLNVFLKKFQIIHQVGQKNLDEFKISLSQIKKEIGSDLVHERYKIFGYFDISEMRNALSAADLVISRAGAGAIFEIAYFEKPSILIPLTSSANNHQRENAKSYSRSGATILFETNNLTSSVVMLKIEEILGNKTISDFMSNSARKFSKKMAGILIADELTKIAKRI